MKRKQIYLPDKTDSLLKKWSLVKGVSEASLVREAVNQYLVKMEAERRGRRQEDPLARFVGHCSESGGTDAAVNHDRYLYEGDGE